MKLTKNYPKGPIQWAKWVFLVPQIVKMISGIPTANTLTKNGQKYVPKWPKMAIFESLNSQNDHWKPKPRMTKNGNKWAKRPKNNRNGKKLIFANQIPTVNGTLMTILP